MKNISKGTIIRTACLMLALINTALMLMGKSPLPIEDAMIEEVVTYIFMAVTSLVAWWENNSFTKPAIEADKVLAKLKAGIKEETE